MSRTRSAPRSSLRPTIATFAPKRASAEAIAPPRTPVPPMTTAVWPDRSNRSRFMGCLTSREALQLRDAAGSDPFGDEDAAVVAEAGVVGMDELSRLPLAFVAANRE